MKLAEVRPGMACTGLSVVRGTAVSEFDVEVIDVVAAGADAASARILIRVSGAAVDATGVGPGFSGSPIHCRGADGVARVAGAISESIGQYGNHVVLATPIEPILGTPARAPRRAAEASALLRSARPLSAPLSVSGVGSPAVRAALASGARAAGVPLLATPGGPAASYPAYPLTPGSSVAAGLSSGDIALASIGTVTYRDGAKLWAFGHPLDGAGRRALPLLDAYVFAVIDNPLGLLEVSTYKLAVPGRPVGALTSDGLAAVAGRVGPRPRTIPLLVRARDRVSGRTRTLRMRVADERRLGLGSGLDLVGTVAATDAMARALGATPSRATTSLCLRVKVRQLPRPMGFCKRAFTFFGPVRDLSQALSLIDGFKYGPLGIEDVEVRIRTRAGVSEDLIVGARGPARARPGQRIRVRLLLRRSRAGRRALSLGYRVPRATRPGRQLLRIYGTGGGSGGLAALFEALFAIELGGGGPTQPRSVPELAARVAALGGATGIRATLARKGKGPVVERTGPRLVRGSARLPIRILPRRR
jgi:hypothetical protein